MRNFILDHEQTNASSLAASNGCFPEEHIDEFDTALDETKGNEGIMIKCQHKFKQRSDAGQSDKDR